MTTPTAFPIEPFRPAPGLGNPHVQTIGGKLLRPRLELELRRERVETPDGDFVDLDGPVAAEQLGDAPRVLVLHGLEGTASRRYMMTTYHALMDRGLRPIGLNFRGCSGEPNRTVRAYHSGETEDLRHVVGRLAERSGAPIGLIGYSLGGNVVLKYLGEAGQAGRADGVRAAAAVSVPFDLAAGSDRIARGLMGRVYTTYFMRSLLRKIEMKEDLLRDACDLEAIRRARTLRQFDEVATSRLHGFEGAADYYERSSSARFVERIRTPTLVVHALDDPFLPPDRIPTAVFAANPSITTVLPERGGHVGFIAGSLLRPRFWAEQVVAAFLAERLGAAESDVRLDRSAAAG